MSPPFNAPHLLIVEDDTDIRDILGTALREEGYVVSLATSLEEALTQLGEQVFYFVLTDLFSATPGALFDSIAALRSQAQPTPVGLLTGWRVSEEDAQRAGFACFIREPFELDEALAATASCLNAPLNGNQQRLAQVVKRFFAAHNERDWDAALDLPVTHLAYYPAPQSLYAPLRKLEGRESYRAYTEDVFRRLLLTRFEQVLVYARPKGLEARYVFGVTLPDNNSQQRAGATLFHFQGDLIARIGVKVRPAFARTLIKQQRLMESGTPELR